MHIHFGKQSFLKDVNLESNLILKKFTLSKLKKKSS